MFKLDDNFLAELGLGALPPADKNKMLAHIYETLEMNVGMRLAEKMTNEQLDEFEAYINKNDEAGALKWLETNFPNYKEVVAEELEKLKAEIRQVAPQIVAQALELAQQNQTLPQQPMPSDAMAQMQQPPTMNNPQVMPTQQPAYAQQTQAFPVSQQQGYAPTPTPQQQHTTPVAPLSPQPVQNPLLNPQPQPYAQTQAPPQPSVTSFPQQPNNNGTYQQPVPSSQQQFVQPAQQPYVDPVTQASQQQAYVDPNQPQQQNRPL